MIWVLRFTIIIGCIAIAPKSSAQDIDTRKSELEQLQGTLGATQDKHANTQKKIKETAQEIAKLQHDIDTKATAIRHGEQQLTEMQRELESLFLQEASRSKELAARKAEMSRLISAAWSLQHRPQLAAWVMPEETRERALSARAMYMTTHSLRQEVDAINQSVQALDALQQAIIKKQQHHQTLQETLRKERATLQASHDAQQQMVTTLKREEQGYAQRLKQLARKARDLKQLVVSLEKAREKQLRDFAHIYPVAKPIPPSTKSKADTQSKSGNFKEAKGVLSLPAEGRITGRYGEKRGTNDRLKGIEIQTLSGAVVSAPYEGEVLFTGPFLDYGKMVIIRHSREYHTLVAGLSRINVSVGQFLLDGAPIGVMGNDKVERQLYLELRRQSQAINPEPWFAIGKRNYATR